MDVSDSAQDADVLNPNIESAARFLNMHVRDGIPASNLKLAVVLHGSAGKDALSDPAYRERFGVVNPNTGLLNALNEAGVKIYICGQTARFRGYAPNELNPAVTMATSAMTVLTRLQVEGWSLLP
jgi:intracellular sulfur oxidation DsrE/DsrF family protein